ncbi:MAG: hypothetical protein AAFR68_18550 [Pseudomonadota bacterium]
MTARLIDFDKGRVDLQSYLAAKPLDGLGLLTLLTSLYFLMMWGFALDDRFAWPSSEPVLYVLLGLCCLGIVAPRFWPIMLLNSLVYAVSYFERSPVASNNQTTAFFVAVVILIGAVVAGLSYLRDRDGDWREQLFKVIAGPGRWLLAVLYFWGIYHKINADFLHPEVSCAVVLYVTLAGDFGLQDWMLGRYAAIYSTFIIEATAMILLFSPRYKLIGIAIGVPFHIIIGWTGYAFYKDFSTVVLVMYAMFLPATTLSSASRAAADWFGSRERANNIGRLILVLGLFAGVFAALAHSDWRPGAPTHEGFVWFFSFYALTFYVFALAFTPWREKNDPMWDFAIRPRWLAILPIAFFLNGASPYFGLKTESSIAMFSNLHTEDNQTNHLLTGQLPFAANYQNETIKILGSNDEAFNERWVGKDRTWVKYQFDAMISSRPDLVVDVLYNGQPAQTGPNWNNTYLETPRWLRKYLVFKPIDYDRPKVCTH